MSPEKSAPKDQGRLIVRRPQPSRVEDAFSPLKGRAFRRRGANRSTRESSIQQQAETPSTVPPVNHWCPPPAEVPPCTQSRRHEPARPPGRPHRRSTDISAQYGRGTALRKIPGPTTHEPASASNPCPGTTLSYGSVTDRGTYRSHTLNGRDSFTELDGL